MPAGGEQGPTGIGWSPPGTLEWSCTGTADHAVDTVFAPGFFLPRLHEQDGYPDMGADYSVGPDARPEQLVQALEVATRVVAAVADAGPEVRAALFPPPVLVTAPPEDFVSRAGVELILHAHDVCAGLGIAFEPAPGLCRRLRDHTHSWAMWGIAWDGLPISGDPWGDLLTGSGRRRPEGTRA